MASIIRFTSVLVISLTVALAALGQELKDNRATQIRFEVLSTKIMSPEEQRRRQSDSIGTDVVVRYRISNCGQSSVYLYSNWRDSIVPAGYGLRINRDKFSWFKGLSSTREASPGIKELEKQGDGGSWLSLPTGASIEFELFDSSTLGGEKHAQTIFMKASSSGNAVEVYSDPYVVPIVPKNE